MFTVTIFHLIFVYMVVQWASYYWHFA